VYKQIGEVAEADAAMRNAAGPLPGASTRGDAGSQLKAGRR
jgi:hypothetical protein